MKEIKFFCDICGKEFPPQEYSFLNGQIIRIDKDLKAFRETFEGHYDGDCTKLILDAIMKLKNDQPTNPNSGTEQYL